MISMTNINPAEIIKQRRDLTAQIKNLLIERLNLDYSVEEIPDDAVLFGGGLGLDSIDALQLIVGIESDFQLTLPQDQPAILRSVNTIADYILALYSQKYNNIDNNIDNSKINPHDIRPPENLLTNLSPRLAAYNAVRTEAGISIYDNWSVLKIHGSEAKDHLDKIITGSVSSLAENSVLQSLLLDTQANIQAYLEIYYLADYYLVLIKTKKLKIFQEYLNNNINNNIIIQDISDQVTLLGLEGPTSAGITEKVLGADVIGMRPKMLACTELHQHPVIVSGMSPAGEAGYCFIVPKNYTDFFIDELNRSAGKKIPVCDLETQQLLKLEACFFDENIIIPNGENLLEAGLHWMIDFKKEKFIGKEALLKLQTKKLSKKLVLFRNDSQEKSLKVQVNDEIILEDKKIGYISVSAYSPVLGKNIGLAYVDVNYAWPGIKVNHDTLGFVSAPFFLSKSHAAAGGQSS